MKGLDDLKLFMLEDFNNNAMSSDVTGLVSIPVLLPLVNFAHTWRIGLHGRDQKENDEMYKGGVCFAEDDPNGHKVSREIRGVHASRILPAHCPLKKTLCDSRGR